VHRVVEPPPVAIEAHQRDDAVHERALFVDWEAPVQTAVVDSVSVLAQRRDHRQELLLELVEQTCHLGALGAGLVIVQEHVIGAVEAIEAVDVLAGQLEVASQVRREQAEVVLLTCAHPCLLAERRSPRKVRGQSSGHPPSLVPMAACDAQERSVIGVVIVRRVAQLGLGRVEQPTRLGPHEHLVADALERG